MNSDDITPTDNTRPFGFWVSAVDRLLEAEFATVFADEGITRRDWRLLNRIDGTFPDRRSPRGPRGPKLRALQAHGWIERAADGWTLTDDGRLAKERLGAAVAQICERVTGAVSPEEYATMTASLEKIAREFGWEEGRGLPRRHGRRGFGPGFGPGFGRGFGPGFGPGHHPHGEHGRHDQHPHAEAPCAHRPHTHH